METIWEIACGSSIQMAAVCARCDPAVRWYCKYGIRYRDVEDRMAERGIVIDPTTL